MNFSFLADNLFWRDLKTYAIALLLAVISWGLVQAFRLEQQINQDAHEAPKHSADYFSKGYLRKDLTEQGLLKNELFAENILHYSDDGTTHISRPKLTLYNSDPIVPPWVVKSDSGILSADGKNLSLNGKVFIERAAAEGVREVKIRTSNLQVQPKTSYATSAQWTELISPPHRIEGVGVQINFKKPIYIKLLSRVKSRYVLN